MTLTDDDLLDFDHSQLAHFDADDAKRALDEQRDVFRAQLVMAVWLDGWRERMADHSEREETPDWQEGFDWAVRNLGAHLRQGDFLPGGVLHSQTDEGRQ